LASIGKEDMDELDEALSPQTVALLEALISSSIEQSSEVASLRQLVRYLCGTLSDAESQQITALLTSSGTLRLQLVSARRVLDRLQGTPIDELITLRETEEAIAPIVDGWLELLASMANEQARWWAAAEGLRLAVRQARRHAIFREGEGSSLEAEVDEAGRLHLSITGAYEEGTRLAISYGDAPLGAVTFSSGLARMTVEGFGAATAHGPGRLPSSHFGVVLDLLSPAPALVSPETSQGAPALEADGERQLLGEELHLPVLLNGTPEDAERVLFVRAVAAPNEAQLLVAISMPSEQVRRVLRIQLSSTLSSEALTWPIVATFSQQNS
jgi:hypothetical protein